MKHISSITLNHWLSILFTVLSSTCVVVWFQYPAQVLFWFFAFDVIIVAFYIMVQLLCFSTANRYLLVVGLVALLGTLLPLVLGSFAILVTQNIIQTDALTTNYIPLIAPILVSVFTYLYITQTPDFTVQYFDRFKVRFFLLFSVGTLFFASWIAYTTFALSQLFMQYYFLGFVVYLVYKIVFDYLVSKFFPKKSNSWDFLLKD